MTRDSLQDTMLDALELFHYSYRFRDSLFVIVLEDNESLEELRDDLRILRASHISAVVLTRASRELAERLDTHNKLGERFRYFELEHGGALPHTALQQAVREGSIPVLGCAASRKTFALPTLATRLARDCGAQKVFLLGDIPELVVDETPRSHLSRKELQELLDRDASFNLPPALLDLIVRQSKTLAAEVVILDAAPGSLFEEIFTHRGRGTLITNEYPNVIRRGELSDVFEISRLLTPYVEAGTIRPVSEEEIASGVNRWFVYTVNGALVAAAHLSDYGEEAELAKFCTLPRFQGRGRARELALAMIEAAKQDGRRRVFALSIEPRMWQFFEGLGLHETPREELPEAWKRNYDFSRPSKAFSKELTLES